MENGKNEEMGLLIKRIAKGDMRALGIIYHKVGKGFKYFAKELLGKQAKDSAEDILHDFMIALVKKAKKLKSEKNVSGWMIKVFENMIKDWLRKRNRLMETSLNNALTLGKCIDDNYFIVQEALKKMNEEERRIIYFKYWYGFSLSEIATIYKIPKSTLEYKLYKIEEKLKNNLNN